jgi:hypothetical protein
MTLSDFLIFSAVAAVLAAVAHFFVRRYWLALLVSAPASSLVNIAHELYTHDFRVRPSDALFWLPMLFVEGIIVALPAVAIVGISFYVIRRRKQANAA